MSFVNIGIDGPPNHTLEIEGDMFVANVEDGTYTPVEIKKNLRFRTKPPGVGSDDYRVTDIQLNSTLFGINRPTSDASGSLTDFCIDGSKNIGIGITPTKKLDIGGSMYVSGTLTNESNVITNSLTLNGTISSDRLAWGPNYNIYGLLPTGAILMTTLTVAPSGWTDVTDSLSFTSNLVMLADNEVTLVTDGGNDNVTLTDAIIHNHGTVTHTSTHTHANPTASLNSSGSHNHSYNIPTGTTDNAGNSHTHNFKDLVVDNTRKWGVNAGYPGSNTVTIMDNNNYANGYVLDNGNHVHDIPSKDSGSSKYGTNGHSHNISLSVNNSNNIGGNHGHTVDGQGSSTSFSIVPPCCNLRFFQKN